MKTEDIKKTLEKSFPPFTNFKRKFKVKDDKGFIHRAYEATSNYKNSVVILNGNLPMFEPEYCFVVVTTFKDDSAIDEIVRTNKKSFWIYDDVKCELKDSNRPWKN